VDNILGSATVAATSATNAATSEANAATSETNAANSATAAASSATSAAASLDSFDDRYLGAKATAPTVDNDGDALIIGALYFDTTTDTMKVYGSSGWVNAGSSVNGTSDRQTYTATAGQTVFAATYDAGYVDVYLNGVKLLAGTDFTAVNGTSIVLASGAANNDIVDIVAYGTFVLADHLTETQSDAKYVQQTHTGDVSLNGNLGIGTTGTPTQRVQIGAAQGRTFVVDQSTTNITRLANDFSTVLEAGGGYDLKLRSNGTSSFGNIIFETAGTTDRMKIASNGDISFYDTSGNAKFVWDASTMNLGIGTDTPVNPLTVQQTSLNWPYIALTNTSGTIKSQFGYQVNDDLLDIAANSGGIKFRTSNTETMRLTSAGNLGLGTQTPQNYSGQTSLTINGSTTGRLDLQGNGVQGGTIFSTNGTGLTVQTGYGKILTLESGTTGNIQFKTNGSEKMQLTQYGNLLVGTTDSTPVGSGSNGTAIGNGIIESLKYKGASLKLDRYGDSNNSNDGSIIEFYSGSSGQVGSIGLTSTQRLTIGSSVDTDVGLVFQPDTDKRIYPVGDDVVELGRTGHRFKDLMLSGGVYLGGTGSANKLDDYEEGTWTPAMSGYSGVTYGTRVGYYTKVGRMVMANFYMSITNIGTYTGNSHIAGLPFAAGISNTAACGVQLTVMTALNATRDEHFGALYNGGSSLFIYDKSGNARNGNNHQAGAYAGTLVYMTS